jgi:hypothetical protein
MSAQPAHIVPTQWNHLPDISDTKPLTANDRACLDAIRDVLERHDCLGRFGVNLLHKHFEMAEDEILVEQVDQEGRRLVTAPVKVALVEVEMPTAYETQWHWQRSKAGQVIQVCVARCFPGSPEAPGHVMKHVAW